MLIQNLAKICFVQFMKIHPTDDSDRSKFVRVGLNLLSIQEDENSATITPKDFGLILVNDMCKQKFFSAIYEFLKKGKEVTVNFGSPSAKTNYFTTELTASDTVDYFDREFGIHVEVTKDKEDDLASAVIFKNVQTDKICLASHEAVDFSRKNIVVRGGDYSWYPILHSPFTQMVQEGKVINIPQNNSPNSKYDSEGLFMYLDKSRNEIQIVLNGEENIEDENLQKTAIVPIVVNALKNGFSVSLNFGSADLGELNYQTHTAKLFERIDHAYRTETCSNLSVRVEGREEVENIFAFVILQPD